MGQRKSKPKSNLGEKMSKKIKPLLSKADLVKDLGDELRVSWAKILNDVIDNNQDSIMMDSLLLEQLEYVPWDILPKCKSVKILHLSGFPSTGPAYIPYGGYKKWYCKPPQESKEQVESLFPPQIFKMTNLEELYLEYYPFSYLSSNICKLQNLRILEIEGSPIICFPESIGKLKKLEVLKFYCSRRMKYAPYELSHCSSLRLTTAGTSRLYANYKNNLLLPPLPMVNTEIIDRFKQVMLIYDVTADLCDVIMDYMADIECSNEECMNRICYKQCIYYGWSRQKPGTDTLCLLAKMCSQKCLETIPKGTRYYCGRMKSDGDGHGCYNNLRLDENGKIDESAQTQIKRDEYVLKDNLDNELKRFEYFWRYNLKIQYNGYKLVEQDHQQLMVKFD